MRSLGKSRLRLFLCLVAAVVLISQVGRPPGRAIVCAAEDSEKLGTVTGQILFQGELPDSSPIVSQGDSKAEDLKACGIKEVPSENWVIDHKSKGLANVFVYLLKRPAGMPQRLEKSRDATVNLRELACRYQPHVLFLRTDQDLTIWHDDPIGHNAHFYAMRNQPYAYVLGRKPSSKVRLRQAERVPTLVRCDIHPWMKAVLLVLDHPYAAITDKDGKFKITDLPPGDHEFVVWHEEKGYIERKLLVKIEGAQAVELKLAVNSDKAAPAKP